MSNIEVTASDDSTEIIMTVHISPAGPPLTQSKLKQAFEQSIYHHFSIKEEALNALFLSIDAIEFEPESTEIIEKSMVVAQAIDAQLSLALTPDNMSATIEATAAQGGKPINRRSLVKALQDHSVNKGIFVNKIDKFIEDANLLKAGETLSLEIAHGRAAVNGKDGYVKFLVEDPSRRILRPKKLANGKVDMRELGNIIHVKQGTQLAKLVSPTAGDKGFTVTGEELQPQPGNPATIASAEGSALSEDNKAFLIASISGMPKHLDNSVSVHRLFEVESVDVGTGNIRFDGSVFVKGNVCPDMKLIASEDIVIGGIVQSADIKAKGNVNIARGIIGNHRKVGDNEIINSVSVVAGGSLTAQFIQYADISVKEKLTVTDYISHSRLIVADNIWVGDPEQEKPHGKLFACDVQSGGSINLGTLGSIGDTSTRVTFDYWEQAVALTKDKAKISETLVTERLAKMYQHLAKPQTQNNEDVLTRVEQAIKQHLNKLVAIHRNLVDLTQTKKKAFTLSHIHVYDTIFGGTNVIYNNAQCQFTRRHPPSTVSWQDGKVRVEPMVSSIATDEKPIAEEEGEEQS